MFSPAYDNIIIIIVFWAEFSQRMFHNSSPLSEALFCTFSLWFKLRIHLMYAISTMDPASGVVMNIARVPRMISWICINLLCQWTLHCHLCPCAGSYKEVRQLQGRWIVMILLFKMFLRKKYYLRTYQVSPSE